MHWQRVTRRSPLLVCTERQPLPSHRRHGEACFIGLDWALELGYPAGDKAIFLTGDGPLTKIDQRLG
jgi:hypothetical protein